MKYQTIILGNVNSTITNNNIGELNLYYNQQPFIDENSIDWSVRNSGKFEEIMEDNKIIASPLRKSILLNDKLERLLFLALKYNFMPTIRLRACFTALCTIQQFSDKRDLPQLELLEHKNILKLLDNNFMIKAIINLDMNQIFSKNAYCMEQYYERCKHLDYIISYYKEYKNLKIVFDKDNLQDAEHILDTLLLCKATVLLFDEKVNDYNQTIFTSDRNVIKCEITNFDNKFEQLLFENNVIRNHLSFPELEDYFSFLYNHKKNTFFKYYNL